MAAGIAPRPPAACCSGGEAPPCRPRVEKNPTARLESASEAGFRARPGLDCFVQGIWQSSSRTRPPWRVFGPRLSSRCRGCYCGCRCRLVPCTPSSMSCKLGRSASTSPRPVARRSRTGNAEELGFWFEGPLEAQPAMGDAFQEACLGPRWDQTVEISLLGRVLELCMVELRTIGHALLTTM